MEVLKGMKSSSISIFLSFALLLLGLLGPVSADAHGRLIPKKPNPENAAATARWLVSQNTWGVLRNVVSFSDGLPGEGCGIPYFYLTTLDPTARDALKNASSSFTVSEVPLGSCGKIDPENPTCAKLTLNGKLKLVDVQTHEGKFALHALFAKHAEMKKLDPEEDPHVYLSGVFIGS
ncbi:hypothetical protein J5N97_026670 [Dioscorea zingiberensis]|uniref:CREG-like beta-barrel domain-containing protein n=1 Tax=Dioscorea zingiberensis TaxID=325984 RepID=A0A9D5C404_9LILI|nr:hypothetical protein J5N97_026670 [Dioscorea zingiberensis]